MKTILALTAAMILTLGAVHTNAQSALAAAFSKSYTQETDGKYNDAIATLKAQYDGKSYETNLRLGYLFYLAKNYTESVAYYQKAVDLLPYSVEAKLGLVLPQSALGNWNQVTATYKGILQVDPQNSTVNYRMGYISYTNKDYQTAFKYLEKVTNLYPFSYDGLILFAWTNYQLGKYQEAKILFNKVLLLSPSDKSALEGLGLIK